MTDDRRERLRSLSIARESESGNGGRGGVPVWAVLLVALGIAALATGVTWYVVGAAEAAPEASAVDSAADPATVATVPVPRATGLVASGYVTARRQATVSAEISGRISEVLIEEGAQVAAGEVLARLDSERARLELDLLDSQIAAADARVGSLQSQEAEARRVLTRAQELLDRGLEADAVVTSARAQQASLEAQLRAAEAELASQRVRRSSQVDMLARHNVRAPFAGVVVAKNAQVGEILSPVSGGGGFTRTGVATLVDMASLEIEVDVNEGQIQRVQPGQPVEAVLDAYPDWRIPARVEAIIPTADRSRATIRVRVAFLERDERILPDMAARVTFIEQ